MTYIEHAIFSICNTAAFNMKRRKKKILALKVTAYINYPWMREFLIRGLRNP